MTTGIYKITCMVTSKVYIGSSGDIEKRFREHVGRLNRGKHDNAKLGNAWKKYGAGAFSFEIVEVVAEPSALASAEQKWMNALNVCTDGFNIAPIARSTVGLNLGRKMPDHVRAAIRAACLGRKQPQREIELRRSKLVGKKRPKDAIERTAAAQRGRTVSDAQRARLSEIFKARPISRALVEAAAAANRGRKRDPSIGAKIGAKKRGIPLTPEHRAKLSVAQKRRFARDRGEIA